MSRALRQTARLAATEFACALSCTAQSWTIENLFIIAKINVVWMCETGLVFNCWRTVKFPKGNGSTEVINGYKRFGFLNWGGGEGKGKIEGRHILIIALSEHHVDYMNRKGWSLRYYAGRGAFSPMYTSDSIDSCMAPGFWQTVWFPLLRLGRDIVRK